MADLQAQIEELGERRAELEPGDKDAAQIVLEAVNRRGKRIQCEVTCTPLLGVENDVTGAILVMEESPDGGRRSS